MVQFPTARSGPVPRGIAETGPAILSYGFRPFFLGAGVFALLSMGLWMAALSGMVAVGGSFGPLNWHAHEMLFGYTTAALAGFLLTAVPNWTGRLPVSGVPLLGLFGLWAAGRVTMAAPDILGSWPSIAVDAAFLPVLAAVAGREIVAGRNWKNLKILGALVGLASANFAFHAGVLANADTGGAIRAAVGLYALLVVLVGGRIIPSFTRNFLARTGRSPLPAPFGRFDMLAILSLAVAVTAWAIIPTGAVVAATALVASVLHFARLARWKGWAIVEEPLLAMLHVSYGFVPVGFAAVAAAALGWIAPVSALHLITVGGIGGMTLAVMTRASLGHTGRPPTADVATGLAYLALIAAAVTRPIAEIVPSAYHLILSVSGAAWLAAFGSFVIRYGPILVRRRCSSPRRTGRDAPSR